MSPNFAVQGTVSVLLALPVTAHAKQTVLANDDEEHSLLCMARWRPTFAAQSAGCQSSLPWQAHVMKGRQHAARRPLQQETGGHAWPAVQCQHIASGLKLKRMSPMLLLACAATDLRQPSTKYMAHKCSMLPPLTLSLASSPGFAGSSASSAAKFDAEEIVKEHRLDR